VSTGLQAKHDAGKLVIATIALLVASLSNLLVVGTCHLFSGGLAYSSSFFSLHILIYTRISAGFHC
jgi:hypothetical protein